MKFMEIDEDGYVHHIRDCPQLDAIPLQNCVSHQDKDKKPYAHPITGRPTSFLGGHWLPPLPISDEDYAKLIKDGLCGVTEKATKWHYKYDFKTKTFIKAVTL